MSEVISRPVSHADWVGLVESGQVKLVQFVPDDTVPIGINGCIYYVERGKPTELPEPFYNVYQQSRMQLAEAAVNSRISLEKRSFGPGQTTISEGWNGRTNT